MSELREKIENTFAAYEPNLIGDRREKLINAILATLALDYARGYAAAREDAARVAERYADGGGGEWDSAAHGIAAAIRALEPKP